MKAFLLKSTKIKGEEMFLIITLLIIFFLVAVFYLSPSFHQKTDRFSIALKDLALSKGLLGAFMVTFLSNSVIFITIPYSTIIFILGGMGLNPLVIGLISGLGAVLGETISYLIGWGGSKIFAKKYERRFSRINKLLRRRPKLTPILIYFLGATPIPDDILLVPLGVIHYPYLKIIIPLTLGKITYTTMMAFLGYYSFSAVQRMLGTEELAFTGFLTLFLTVVIIYFTLKINWDKIIAGKTYD